ncbi:death-associated inhibitor of apoptosis 2 [Drosophila guanche]|uniref:Blast:Apoptosis 2 inhibitor n=1 Tax=Drosophila guanche TaxID=7266 RepID=A0A3B0IYZ9_DROGU|nr:death-associated inhibitor of apoptosis 2 [Drosophila guanche]SPP73285.1 blast:Apoptosis 2 inhibitor [Drosophila guanche]
MTEPRLELESVRTATFAVWPLNAPVSIEDLATNGFFATGNWLEAECNWCHVRIDRWEYGDQVAERHRRSSPICSMVLAPNHCGNVTLSQENDNEGNSMVDGGNTSPCACPDMLIEANRLETFKDWPNPNVTPQALAKAGFYYLNFLDHVKCVWCNGVIAKWEKNDNAFEEHRRFFPNCPRVQMGPLIEFAAGKNLEELGIQPTTQPQRPKYACVDARLRTFSDWPIGNIQPPVPLAQAGLYYQKIGDQVRCFHCNIGLRSWQKEDEPWHEHAKWSPKCQFVLLAKGPTFVNEVRETMAATSGSRIATAPAPQLDALMDEGPAKEALALGIDGGVVRNTIQRKLSSSGCAFETLDELLHAIFDEAGSEAALEVREPTEPTAPPLDCCQATTSKAAAAAATDLVQFKPQSQPQQAAMPERSLPEQMQSMSLASANGNISLEEENRQLKDARLCKVCLDEEVGVVFLPCGHLATCNQCAPSVSNCPMCRADIKGFVRTFLS